MARKLLLIAVAILATRCATAVNGRFQTISVDSFPSGAAITVDCGASPSKASVTPAKIQVSRAAERCALTLTREGYEPRIVNLEHQESRATALNAVFGIPGAVFFGLLGAILGSAVDGTETGAAIGAEAGYGIGTEGAVAVDKAGGGMKWVPGKVYVILLREGTEEEARNAEPPPALR